MVFSRRSAHSCSCQGTGAGATGISSPIRTNEAISAPPRAERQAGTSSKSVQLKLRSAQLPCYVSLPPSNAAVRVRITRILLNYRRLRCDGQRLRCAIRNSALSNRNSWGPFQHSLNEHVKWLRQGLTLPLGDGRLFLEQTFWKLDPGRSCRRKSIGRSAQNQRVGAVESNASRILEIFLRRIDHREIEAGLQKLQ